jgi:hypothetical protein
VGKTRDVLFVVPIIGGEPEIAVEIAIGTGFTLLNGDRRIVHQRASDKAQPPGFRDYIPIHAAIERFGLKPAAF